MRSTMLALAMLLSVAIIACVGDNEGDADEGMEQIQPAPPLVEPARTLNFEAGPGATTAGTLVVMPTADGQTEISVDVTGLTPGEHAWHVHLAACGSDGPIALPFTDIDGRDGITGPLDANDEGRATAHVTIEPQQLSAGDLRSGRYSIHIHQGSGAEPGPTVACVTLR